MPDNFYGGLDFGTSGARISIIDLHKELVYSDAVPYLYSFKNPSSWINSCEKLLDNIPIEVKSNLNKLAISGTSGTLMASNLKGEPMGKAIPYDQACNENKILLESLASGEDHLRTPFSSLAKALKLIIYKNILDASTNSAALASTFSQGSSRSLLPKCP